MALNDFAIDHRAADQESWHALGQDSVEQRLETRESGLSPQETQARLQLYGFNQLEEEPPTHPLVLFLRQFRNPLTYILLAAASVTLVLREYIDVATIIAVIVLDAIIGFIQERRAEHSVRALSRMVSSRARVVRQTREQEVESRFVVPGDLVLLEPGTRVPADIRLTATNSLHIDESSLTGESVSIAKQADMLPSDTGLSDRTNMAFAGTVTTSGRGRGYVVATGTTTELGLIASEVREAKEPPPPLQQRLSRFARVVNVAVIVAVFFAVAIGLIRGESGAEMFRVAVALAVAAIPEGLPAASTIALAVGVRRMARRKAIVRRLSAVETLGSVSCIGTDKTGTLTENRMRVHQIWTGGEFIDIDSQGHAPAVAPDALRMTLIAGILTNEATVSRLDGTWDVQGDPTETALLISAINSGLDPQALRRKHPLVADLPFESDLQYSASIREQNGHREVYVKGAPERIVAMCDRMRTGDGSSAFAPDVLLNAAHVLTRRGLRVLAMAYGPTLQTELPLREPTHLVFLGFQAMQDAPRAGVAEAIALCKAASVRVVMITGDHAETARAIGRDLGIASDSSDVLTGAEIDTMDDDELRVRSVNVPIYARVSPQHKLRVVHALQASGAVVAVTGDGVNDAPALKAADVGIAMGRGGTDVAREAADVVLADDNFVTIVAAVREGRITFQNIRNVTFFLVGTGAGELLIILSVLVLGWPLPFLPAQILWLNLVMNGFQDVALAFEPGEPDAAKQVRPTRQEGILSRLLWQRAALTAIVVTIGTLVLFKWELDHSGSLAQSQTVALTTMVVFQVFQAGNARSDTRSLFRMRATSNLPLFVSTVAALAVHLLALYLPPGQYVLRVEPIELTAWVRIIVVASSLLIAVELEKAWRRRRSMRVDS